MAVTSTGSCPTLWQASTNVTAPACAAEVGGLGHRVDQAPVGADVGQAGERHVATFQRGGQGLEVEGPVGRAGHRLDGGPGHARHLEQAHVVAVVGDAVDQDPTTAGEAAAEEQAPQGLGPPLGVRTGDRHLGGVGAQQRGHRGAHGGQPVPDRRLGLVAAHVGLEPEVGDDGVHRGRRRQRGAGVVQMGDRGTARRGRPLSCDVECWGHARDASAGRPVHRGPGCRPR